MMMFLLVSVACSGHHRCLLAASDRVIVGPREAVKLFNVVRRQAGLLRPWPTCSTRLPRSTTSMRQRSHCCTDCVNIAGSGHTDVRCSSPAFFNLPNASSLPAVAAKHKVILTTYRPAILETIGSYAALYNLKV